MFKILVVGAGNIGSRHVQSLVSNPQLSLTVVHPSSNKIASRSAKLFHIELDKYPKVINSVKKISPNTKLIAFKALYSSSFSENEDHVLQTVNELFEESQADLVILNDVSNPNSGFASD